MSFAVAAEQTKRISQRPLLLQDPFDEINAATYCGHSYRCFTSFFAYVCSDIRDEFLDVFKLLASATKTISCALEYLLKQPAPDVIKDPKEKMQKHFFQTVEILAGALARPLAMVADACKLFVGIFFPSAAIRPETFD